MGIGPAVRWSSETRQADWVAARLAPFGSGALTSVVPGGFAAYARLLHPIQTADPDWRGTVRWAEVAAWSDTPIDPAVQFHDIALPPHTPPGPRPGQGQGPAVGTLAAQDAKELVAILREHTTTPDRCWFCMWDGHGWDTARGLTAFTDADGDTVPGAQPPIDPVPARVRAGPRVRLPGRDYLLYTGPVADALAFVPEEGQTPSLWWPEDRSWCVASEIDLSWSYLAGPTALVERVLTRSGLEALRADPDDNVHLRVRGWLADVIETAVTDLLDAGNATIPTSRGTVRARLRRPTRLRRGRLDTTYRCVDGGSGSGNSTLETTRPDGLRRQVRDGLTFIVVDLADQ
ncbi:MAG: hypothetical protein ACRDQA_22335 [Nocardioidaceae bacterium]